MNTENPRIRIYTLGRLEVLIDGQPLRFARRAPLQPLNLLTAVIAAGGRAVSVSSLADLLWPEADGFDAYRAFTTTLHRLRRLLKYPQALRLSAGRVTLDAGWCDVDVWSFERAWRAARDGGARADALTIYRGPFLADDPSPWALAMRARLEGLVLR